MSHNTNVGAGWKVDKHIPLAVLVAIFIQVSTSIWYASKLDSRVSAAEDWIGKRDSDTNLMVRMDERLKILSDQVARMDARLDKKSSR